ncbi:MAG: sugar phosphate isomerase/epimerase [Spirochaetes bacterium]|nr:sugar phosphate isomerase/epimerase [Spirochaetota bacterium]
MEILISRFVSDENMDLSLFTDSAMQVAFFQRKVFRNFDHSRFNKRLKDHQISVRSIHAPATDVYHQANNEFMDMLQTIIDIYQVNTITIHPQRGEKKQAKRYYQKLEEEIKKMGIILAYETFEEEAVNRKWISQLEEMHKYFDVLKFPFLGITYDFTHSTYEKSLEEVSRYHEKIKVVHLSDAKKDKPLDMNEYHQHLPLGSGDYKVIKFIDLLLNIKYQHFVVLEYHPEYDHLLKTDAQALQDYILGNQEPLLEIIEQRKVQPLKTTHN